MKPWWVILLSLAVTVLAFVGGRLTSPTPKPEIVERWSVRYDTLPAPPAVVVTVPVILAPPDSTVVWRLLDSIANKDSLIMELTRARSALVPFSVVYYDDEKLSPEGLKVSGIVNVLDCILNGTISAEVYLDPIAFPYTVHDSIAVVELSPGIPWTTYGLIGLGGALVGAATVYAIRDN
jgi:hypothetical protein